MLTTQSGLPVLSAKAESVSSPEERADGDSDLVLWTAAGRGVSMLRWVSLRRVRRLLSWRVLASLAKSLWLLDHTDMLSSSTLHAAASSINKLSSRGGCYKLPHRARQ